MNDARIQDIPLILETPNFETPMAVWAKEIAVLQQLSTVVTESKENRDALHSIIGDVNTDEALVDIIKKELKAVQEAKGKKTATGKKTKKSGKRKRGESSEEEDDDENED
jgi:AP endonuclease-1